MRRTPSHDTTTNTLAQGATMDAFDAAYRELARARAAYDAAQGNPNEVPVLAEAAASLAAARATIRDMRTAA